MVCVWGEWEEFREWKRSKECFEVGARRRAIRLAERVRVEGCAMHCTAMQLVKVVKGNLSKWMTTPQTLWDIGSEREMESLGHPSGE